MARNLMLLRGGRALLAGVDLTLRVGERVGIVGRNGTGKSSLLRLLAGAEPPDEGRVLRAPGVQLALLPQRPELPPSETAWQAALSGLQRWRELERELRAEERQLADGAGDLGRYGELRALFDAAGGFEAETRLLRSLQGFGLEEEALQRPVSTLSGGELARLALARALAAAPDVLLLDEPSNHLDLQGLRRLGAVLRAFPGGLVLVSHDRALLDEVATHTAELRSGRLELVRGGYSELREQQGLRRRGDERRARERRKEAERLERTAAELRRWGNAKAHRLRKRLERRLEGPPPVRPGERGEPPRLETREARGVLLEARHLSKTVAGKTLIVDAQVRLEAGDKVALLGANGAGKSTLLQLLAGVAESDDPRVVFEWHRDAKLLYLDQQERGLAPGESALEQLSRLVSGQRARDLLALAGLPFESWQAPSRRLSGGERARAGLALLLAAQANVLLMDEPTNDLDIGAIEMLQGALQGSDATVVMVTHDRELARLAERVWSLEEGELREYRGGLEGFLAGRLRIEPGLPAAAEAPEPADAAAPRGEPTLEQLEDEHEAVERSLDDPLRLSTRERERLQRRRRELLDELSEAYDRRLDPPRPTLVVREAGIPIGADRSREGLSFHSPAPVKMRLILHDGVGHLVLRPQAGSELLPWARRALVDGAVRLSFYLLRPEAVQHASAADLGDSLLRPLSHGWWQLPRWEFELLEGWQVADEPGPGRRRLRHHPDWEDWVAYRRWRSRRRP